MGGAASLMLLTSTSAAARLPAQGTAKCWGLPPGASPPSAALNRLPSSLNIYVASES